MTTERYHHRRPIDHGFYDQVEASLAGRVADREQRVEAAGAVVALEGGDVLTVALPDGPQVVHLFAWNPADLDERIWPHETSSVEDAFLRRHSRIWSTMARYRPLLTVVEDTLITIDRAGEPIGRHHFVLGGWEVPAVWAASGGRADVPTAWERMRTLLARNGGDTSTYRDHISLFQKISIDQDSQRLTNLRSDALVGDRISLFAELDLRVAVLPSPYGAGGTPPRQLSGDVAPVEVRRFRGHPPPLPWPYPGVPYPDITPYIDDRGQRT
jgi:uncharacterized protein YcgI (DUF1989 family)